MYELKYVIEFEDGTYQPASEYDMAMFYYSDIKFKII